VSGATLIVVLVCAGLGVVAVLSSALRSGKPTPSTPAVPVTPTTPAVKKRPAPKFLGYLWGKPWYGKGERIVIDFGARVGCEDDGPNTPKKQIYGLKGNGSGPYKARVSVFDTKTGARMPIYEQWGNATGPEIKDGVVELTGDGDKVCGSAVFYGLAACPYVNGSLGPCNEFIEFPELKELTPKGKKAARTKACGCGGTDGHGNAVATPTQPTTLVRVSTVFVNADGEETLPQNSDLVVETRSCS